MSDQPDNANNDIIIGDNGELAYLLAEDTIVGREDVSEINFEHDNSNPLLTTSTASRTIAPTFGDADVIRGNSDNDIIFAGTGGDTVWGDTSDDDDGLGVDGPDGTDVIFGDFGKLYYSRGITAAPGDPFYNNFFFSIDTSSEKGGLGDLIFGNANDDFLIGGQGDDLLFGGTGNDDIIGGHNISGTVAAAQLLDGKITADQLEHAHDDLDGLVIGTYLRARAMRCRRKSTPSTAAWRRSAIGLGCSTRPTSTRSARRSTAARATTCSRATMRSSFARARTSSPATASTTSPARASARLARAACSTRPSSTTAAGQDLTENVTIGIDASVSATSAESSRHARLGRAPDAGARPVACGRAGGARDADRPRAPSATTGWSAGSATTRSSAGSATT